MDHPVEKDTAVVVTFTTNSPPYNSGDSAGFPKGHAKSLVEKKLAILASVPFLERVGLTKSKAAMELEAELEAAKANTADVEAPKPEAPKAEVTPADPTPEEKPTPSADRGRHGRHR